MNKRLLIIILTVAILSLVLFGVCIGAKRIDVSTSFKSIVGHLLGVFDTTVSTLDGKVIWNIRLPRVLLSAIVGAALAVSGAAIQGLFRNPLADSNLIGISAGAALFVSVGILFIPISFGIYTLPILAFVGSFVTLFLVYGLAKSKSGVSVSIMLLGGIAITAIAMSIVGYLTFVSTDDQLRELSFWQLGSTGGASWIKVGILFFSFLVGMVFLLKESHSIDAISLGEENAKVMGVNTRKTKNIVLFSVALLVGVSTAFTGAIGFVGLMAPHICRTLTGGVSRFLMIASALTGSVLLVLGDTISRTIVAPQELPIGVITAFVGGPFFIVLLIKNKRKFSGFV
jgi:iron complex transport system permease protein